eukprot:GHVH01016726.1.p1 GENE.GHVH01016726.1~~GHVH01016726.1.p1  ORF type:complete len:1212 (+),score=156.41 GHVH01016726.1:125-3760(+)
MASLTTAAVLSTVVPVVSMQDRLVTEVDSHFGYHFKANMESSVVINSITPVISPTHCHSICQETVDCKAWQYGYLPVAPTMLPSCTLFSSVEWLDNSSVSLYRTVVGDMEAKLKRKVAPCDMESCKLATMSLPLFAGPHAKLIFTNSCSADDSACLSIPLYDYSSYPVDPHCCRHCGVESSIPCDLETFHCSDEHGGRVVPDGAGLKETVWMELFQGPPRGFHGHTMTSVWGCWSTSHGYEGVTVGSSVRVDSVEECQFECATVDSCVAWAWRSSKLTSSLQMCDLLRSVSSVVEAGECTESHQLKVVGLPHCLPVVSTEASAFLDELMSMDIAGLISGAQPRKLFGISNLVEFLKNKKPTTGKADGMVDHYSPFGRRLSGHDGWTLNDVQIQFEEMYPGSELVKFAFSKTVLDDLLQTWVEAASSTLLVEPDIDGVSSNALEVVCRSSFPSECEVTCALSGTSVGLMEVGIGYQYSVFEGVPVLGPPQFRVMVIDGLCPMLIEDMDAVSTSMPDDATLEGASDDDCLQGGHLTSVPSDPISTVDADADGCLEVCLARSDCLSFNYVGTSCELKQGEVTLDLYSIESEDLCQLDCDNDSECHSMQFREAVCHLYDESSGPLVSTGHSRSTATGPVKCMDVVTVPPVVSMPPMNTPAPNYTRDVNEQGVNMISIGDFDVTVQKDGNCPQDFKWIGSRCLGVYPHRLSLADATRVCSDVNSRLFKPTASLLVALCSSGMVDCTASGRGSHYWTRLSVNSDFEVTEGSLLAGLPYDEILSPSEGLELDECVLANFHDMSLEPSSCGGYCVAPPTKLSEMAKTSACEKWGTAGLLAVKRRPFICEYVAEAVVALPTVARDVSYTDDAGVKRCARQGEDIMGGDMWNTAAWDQPVLGWEGCEGLCRDIQGCNGFTYVPSYCEKSKGELDKGWDPAVVFTEQTRQSSVVSTIFGQAECDARCTSDKECNFGAVYFPGVCYLKSIGNPESTTLQWINNISGPVDCAEVPPSVPFFADVGCPGNYLRVDGEGRSLCVGIGFDRQSAPEAHRSCAMSGGVLASPKTEADNQLVLSAFCPSEDPGSCIVPRGNGALDGVFFFGLGSTEPNLNDQWRWVDGSELTYYARFGGQEGNLPLVYNNWPTVQPDNTSGNQLCSYFYPRDSPNGTLNGYWGDEDCDTKCLVPASPNLILTHAPLCNDGQGRITTLGRRYVCTKEVEL